MNLQNYVYIPAIRTTQLNLGAIDELDKPIKDKIIPRLIIRGTKTDYLDSFLAKWGEERPIFLEVSKYNLDINFELNQKLNNPKNHFENQYNFFYNRKNYQIIPVINEILNNDEPNNLRDIIQFAKKLVISFPKVAIKLDIQYDFQGSFNVANNILAMLEDEQIKNIILIVDAGRIENSSKIAKLTPNINKSLKLIENNHLTLVVFSSTSYPDSSNRPDTNQNRTITCFDPMWQYFHIKKLKDENIQALYGDFSATDPLSEKFEFDFTVRPIPYATYLLKDRLEWYTLRKGRGGENEKFRDIARDIQSHPDYHGNNFCYATKTIASIANGSRNKAGHLAFWNKLKINQHISAIIDAHNNNLFELICNEDYDDEDYDDED